MLKKIKILRKMNTLTKWEEVFVKLPEAFKSRGSKDQFKSGILKLLPS